METILSSVREITQITDIKNIILESNEESANSLLHAKYMYIIKNSQVVTAFKFYTEYEKNICYFCWTLLKEKQLLQKHGKNI
jgi:histone acetyltransferase (RNA polymerase elongator complex component)